jgi:non-specific serine/threonine protein kinase/serine/threonine-protein kinase
MSEVGERLSETLTTHPQQIGPYRIVRVLGEGGMGIVYEAVESGAVRRRVALKVVRAGLRSAEVKARFEAERQALALMDHPGIATVYQAGETTDGEPYFAMELVKGLPIDEFCDTRKLSTEERLQLFIAVCEAVQHAHQKGVIHRDLKPSNVLVTEQDGRPQPKIIDFGIAKALGLHLTEKTYITQAGVPLGTAAYMSPEQAESSGIDVDTRSDIYSLGVILYLLLVGRIPIEPSEYGIHAFMYKLGSGDTQTPRPSVRFDSLGEYRDAVADARRTSSDHLRRKLSGDIDWIVMKALEPNRARRYETPAAFVSDIEHFLRNETVTARPPTATYRIRKFIRRNRVPVLAAGLAALALVLSTIFASAGMVRATRAERVAANEAAAAQQVSDFMVGVFKVEQGDARADRITAVELLDRGAKRSELVLADQPVLQGRMMQTIGAAYSSLGSYEAARAQLERALKVRTQALGPNSPAVAETELSLGRALANHGDTKDAEQHYMRALAIRERGPVGADTAKATVIAAMAGLRLKQGRPAEAEQLYRQALKIDEATAGSTSLPVARDVAGLGIIYYVDKRYAEAEPMMKRSVAIREKLQGPGHPDLASSLNNLGGLYWAQERYADALPVLERTRAIYERTLDPMHPYVASVLNNVAETYWKLGRYKEAEPLFKRALMIKEARLDRNDPSIATTLNSYAGMLRDAGRRTEAEAAYTKALAIREHALAPGSADLKATVEEYAQLLREMGRNSEADALLARHGIKG